jgi:hypothetical protein
MTITEPKPNHRIAAGLIAALLLAAGTLTTACVDHVDTAIKSCPCAAGNVCCASGVCAADQDACAAATAALSASVQGRWTGYIENFRPDVDDAIAVDISAASDGTLSGTVRFGKGAAPPAASDPALPWPPGPREIQTSYVVGVDYTARDIAWLSRRLKLTVETYEPWQPWCALQQSYPGEPDGFMCIPQGTLMDDLAGQCWIAPESGPVIAIDCDKASLCFEMCTCDASGCEAWDDVTYALDVAFHDAAAEGSINMWNANYNLRLTRTGNAP